MVVRNSTVFHAAPIVWSMTTLMTVLRTFNCGFFLSVLLSSLARASPFSALGLDLAASLNPGNADSRFSSHKNVSGEMITAHVVNCNRVRTSSSNGLYFSFIHWEGLDPAAEVVPLTTTESGGKLLVSGCIIRSWFSFTFTEWGELKQAETRSGCDSSQPPWCWCLQPSPL